MKTNEHITQESNKGKGRERYGARGKRRSLPLSVDKSDNGELYFNPGKKCSYMRNIVDGYFEGKSFNQYSMELPNIKDKGSVKKKPRSNVEQIQRVRDRNLSHPLTNITDNAERWEVMPTPLPRSFLPPIHETLEDMEVPSVGLPELGGGVDVPFKQIKNDRVLAFENEVFKVYILMKNGKPTYRVKQFTVSGLEIMRREERVMKLGIETIWKHSTQNINTFITNMNQPLKNLTCRIQPSFDGGSAKFKVTSTHYRKYLLANGCEELKHVIREICSVLKKVEGKILNNKLNPTNIFVEQGGKVSLGEWGYSSFRDQFDIQQSQFQSRTQPILKSQKDWLVTPEYLAPEILVAISSKDEEEPDLWRCDSSSDIWSLGLTIFEVLTMIPIWLHEKCLHKLKSGKPVVREGLLAVPNRDINKLLKKQTKLEKQIQHILQTELQTEKESQIPAQIKYLVQHMIVFEPQQRISLDKILQTLK